VRVTGLARSTVSASLDELLDWGVLEEAGEVARPIRGRPAHRLVLSRRAGVLLVVDLDVQGARLAVFDLAQQVLARDNLAVDVRDGPTQTLGRIADRLDQLLGARRIPPEQLRAVVLGLPAPVDVRGGVPVRPPIMPGWDGFPVAQTVAARFGCAALVDNDANLMALGEARALPPDQCPMLLVKVASGIGGGLVRADGLLHHGIDGAAGDVGHVRVPGAEDVRCHCGGMGCIEAIASVNAIAERLIRDGRPPSGTGSPVEWLQDLLRRGDPAAAECVTEAAALLGGVVATLVHFYNPSRVVITGPITQASDHLLAGVRSVVYQQGLPLATRNLTLAHSVLGDDAGLAGGVVTGIEHVLSPDVIRDLAPA
jgi:predicted NBD/HSP70 family sugar kinase